MNCKERGHFINLTEEGHGHKKLPLKIGNVREKEDVWSPYKWGTAPSGLIGEPPL
jgi:hypothetical protein